MTSRLRTGKTKNLLYSVALNFGVWGTEGEGGDQGVVPKKEEVYR